MTKLFNLAARVAVRSGVSPRLLGWRGLCSETLRELLLNHYAEDGRAYVATVHPSNVFTNPLPLNVSNREEMPADAGWWGYSFQDVPARHSSATVLARLPECQVITHLDAQGEFWTSIIAGDRHAVEMREMQFRGWQRQALMKAPRTKVKRATWLVERVYDNYSHWLSAHLPKLLLFRELGLAGQVLLPAKRAPFIDESLRLFGFDPDNFITFEPGTVLEVEQLTLLDTDRFRPELLTAARSASPIMSSAPAGRRIFISREAAKRRKLINEAEVWPILERAGFERVTMEQLSFTEQVRLMQETEVLCAPHGAGLTNMLFCPSGTHVIEIADPTFPNPNFYAMASALGLPYHIVRAEGRGNVHPLEQDLFVAPADLEQVIIRLPGIASGSRCESVRE